MNISDYFKSKPDKPIDALVQELQRDTSQSIYTKKPQNKNEVDALVDDMLGNGGGGICSQYGE